MALEKGHLEVDQWHSWSRPTARSCSNTDLPRLRNLSRGDVAAEGCAATASCVPSSGASSYEALVEAAELLPLLSVPPWVDDLTRRREALDERLTGR